MTPPCSSVSTHGLRIDFHCALLVFCLVLAAPGLSADRKAPTPPAIPSTLPPTSPMIASPSADVAATPDQPPGKLISSEMSGRDLEFFTKAVDAGREQAYFIELLKTRASSGDIKALAEALATTQDEENQHIARLAALKGWNVSFEPTSAQKKAGAELDKLTGSNFDKAAMDKVVAASHQAMSAYEDAAQSKDVEIKKFASQMLPLAEEKRHMVEKMTGAGSKAANQLFRHSAAPDASPSATPAATPSAKGTPAATPVSKVAPSATPGASPVAKGTPAGKHAATPTPSASTLPVATPPGPATLGTPAPNRPAILPPKAAANLSLPGPIPPPIPN